MRRQRSWRTRSAGLCLVLAVWMVCSTLTATTAAAAGPSDLIRQFYGRLLDTMQRAAALVARGRYQRLEPIVFSTFDVPFIAKLSIGSLWAGLTPEQKQRTAKA